MPSQITIRFAHFASRAPVFELSTDPAITIGQLKDMVQERLATEEVCMMREFGKWYAECEVLGRLRSVEISQLDEHAPLSSMVIADLSVVLLEESLPSNPTVASLIQPVVTQLALNKHLVDRCIIASEAESMIIDEKDIRACLQSAEEDDMRRLLASLDNSPIMISRRYLTQHPGNPMAALWKALNTLTLPGGPLVPMGIVKSKECGTEKQLPKFILRNKNRFAVGPGSTPLILAVNANRFDVVKELFSIHAKIHVRTSIGDTPLIVAAANGFTDILRFLLMVGANINEPSDSGLTPLHWAVIRDKVEAIEMLVTQGADLKARCKKNKAPYQYLDEDTCPEYKKMLALLTPK